MKYFLLMAVLLVSTLPAHAEEIKGFDSYIQSCSRSPDYSPNFCKCSLNEYSDKMREGQERKLQERETYQKSYTEALLQDSAITQDKLDAVCDLHDQSLEYNRQASLLGRRGSRAEYDALIAKKLERLEQKRKLVESYGASHQSLASLISGKYCDNRHEIIQMQKDLAVEDAAYYPEILRILETNPEMLILSAVKVGFKMRCEQ